MDNLPLEISVIVPAYQAENTVRRALKSVASQTRVPKEVIVVDDGSKDGTALVAESMRNSMAGINLKVLRQDHQGAGAARNTAIREAQLEYVAFLDDDDHWSSDHIENLLKMVKLNDEFDLAISDFTVTINNDLQQTHFMEEFCNDFKETIYVKPGPFFQCCLFKRSLLQQPEDLFDTNAIPSEDWDFFMNLSERNPLIVHSSHIGFYWN